MNCTEVRAYLPLLLQGDLEPAPRGEVEKHLSACPDCRQEQTALEQTRKLLAAVPAPAVEVDIPRLYREAAERHARQARRWRRVAAAVLVTAATAACVAVGLRLEVRAEAHQMVLRWGSPPPAEPSPAPTPPAQQAPLAPEDLQRLSALEDQLRLMGQIVHALADNADTRDRQRQREIARLRERLEDLQQQTAQRWTAIREYAEALFIAKLNLPKQGAIP